MTRGGNAVRWLFFTMRGRLFCTVEAGRVPQAGRSTWTNMSKKLDAGKSGLPPGAAWDSTSPELILMGALYAVPARTAGRPGGGPPQAKATRFSFRSSVWTSCVPGAAAQGVSPRHGHPGGAESIFSLTTVLALPTGTPFRSAGLPSVRTSLRPIRVVPSNIVGLVQIRVVGSYPGQPLTTD